MVMTRQERIEYIFPSQFAQFNSSLIIFSIQRTIYYFHKTGNYLLLVSNKITLETPPPSFDHMTFAVSHDIPILTT